MFNVSMFNVDLRPREGEFLSARGKYFCRARPPSVSFISTLQSVRYFDCGSRIIRTKIQCDS